MNTENAPLVRRLARATMMFWRAVGGGALDTLQAAAFVVVVLAVLVGVSAATAMPYGAGPLQAAQAAHTAARVAAIVGLVCAALLVWVVVELRRLRRRS
ncbi:MAG: hypothetical protein JW809_16565 [Pirellulales bacterium]|nr:hypothetical protein [Pirellulales bacterium]